MQALQQRFISIIGGRYDPPAGSLSTLVQSPLALLYST